MAVGGSGLARSGKLELSPGGLGFSGLSDPGGLSIPIVPEFANVEILAGFNGVDAAIAFTEESTNAAVATFAAQAQLDTAFQKFGSASLLLDGALDTLTFPDIAAYTLGAGDFTIEGFIRFAGIAADGALASHYNNVGDQRAWFFRWLQASAVVQFVYSVDGIASTTAHSESFTPVVGTFHHWAVSRIGVDMRLFIDGLQKGSTFNAGSDSIFNSTEPMRLGAVNSGGLINDLDGHIDEFRLVVGQGIYESDFAPPTAEFPRS